MTPIASSTSSSFRWLDIPVCLKERPVSHSCLLAPDPAANIQSDRRRSCGVFNERGGKSVVTDVAGNVYIAGSEVWIYDRKGKPLGVVEVPERPGSLAFGGPDRRTLFIAARTSLYSIRAKTPGR
jgi:sugar lactone lactonase YvrE